MTANINATIEENTNQVQASTNAAVTVPQEEDFQLPRLMQQVSEEEGPNARFAIQFGGQSSPYLEELAALCAKYDRVQQFVALAQENLQEEAEKVNIRLTPLLWVQDVAQRPVATELLKAIYSYPLIALTQLANYIAFLEEMHLSHQEMLQKVAVATGHSQGVVSAAIISAAKDDDHLIQLSLRFLRYLFLHGYYAQVSYDKIRAMLPSGSKDNKSTPMIGVAGLAPSSLQSIINTVNSKLKLQKEHQIQLSLINASDMCVTTGHEAALFHLNDALTKLSSNPDQDQNRVPYSQRKPVIKTIYLKVSAPFHNTLLGSAFESIVESTKALQLEVTGNDLQVPVLSTDAKTTNLQTLKHENIMSALISMQLTEVVDWPKVVQAMVSTTDYITHVLDFGPSKGASPVTNSAIAGYGIQVIVPTLHYETPLSPSTDFLADPIYDLNHVKLTTKVCDLFGESWEAQYSPRYTTTESNELQLQNKFTDTFGRPPIWVGGMTPTTSFNGINLVSAIANSGYIGELACGGLPRPSIFESKVNTLLSQMNAGCGIFCNLLYLNAKQWAFQFPMLLTMRAQGIPIEGVTIGAGIPTPEKAKQILSELLSVQIRNIAFKPSSSNAIHDVLTIAKDHPQATIIIQWTGGRAGGHHSFEDFHSPILATYSAIRKHPNVVLVVGSGFGSAKQMYPYLSGNWSKDLFNVAKMPVDGILVASCIMVAKEAATAYAVKELLVQTPGIEDDSEWEKTYTDHAGGVITLKSELGEPIHQIANRGALCWREFDQSYFSLPVKEMVPKLLANKRQIITRLNNDFQKCYFGITKHNEVVDIPQMTYYEVIHRMITLMFVKDQARWLDSTYLLRVFMFMERTEASFLNQDSVKIADCIVQSLGQLKNVPYQFLAKYLKQYPAIANTLLSNEDVDYFIHLCNNNGKPVNFIPIIDNHFQTYFKKDSLWYSEDLYAVPNQDAQRVMILQGPVAVHTITKFNEPVADMLNGMYNGCVSLHEASSSSFTTSSPLKFEGSSNSNNYSAASGWKSIVVAKSKYVQYERTVTEDDMVAVKADNKYWMDELKAIVPRASWCFDLLNCNHLVTTGSKKWIENYILNLVQPRQGQRYVIEADTNSAQINVISLSVYDSVKDDLPVYTLSMPATTSTTGAVIKLELNIVRPETTEWESKRVALALSFTYLSGHQCPRTSCIHVQEEATISQLLAFYADHWLDEAARGTVKSAHDVVSNTVTVSEDDIFKYNATLELDTMDSAPLDFSTVAGWQPLIQSVFSKEINGDLLKLVHLSHSYNILNHSVVDRYYPNDVVHSEGKVLSVLNSKNGKIVKGNVVITKNGIKWLEITSEFLIRGTFEDHENTFDKATSTYYVQMTKDSDIMILQDKHWFTTTTNGATTTIQVCDTLRYVVESFVQFQDGHKVVSNVEIIGKVYNHVTNQQVGSIELHSSKYDTNPVLDYLHRVGSTELHNAVKNTSTKSILFESPIAIHVPASALEYAQASRDLNPIHRCNYSAALASLPNNTPIMHGMWTATKVRNVIMAQMLSVFQTTSMSFYHTNFQGMIYCNETVYLQCTQEKVSNGNLHISIQVVNNKEELVLNGEIIVDQPRPAFVFTGQGSAEMNMGMQDYASSEYARGIWDAGDAHLLAKYGFSILQIVRTNPKSITIHFGGRKGIEIRKNYMDLTCEKLNPGTNTMEMEMVPLIPEITNNTESFTFSAPNGLLFATQFSQPALVLLEKASYTQAQKYGVVPSNCYFAGHSLGEYAALSSFADILETADLAEVVFLRGMVMQNAVERDSDGHSAYGMIAANPSRVGSDFTAKTLFEIIDVIESQSNELCQVVNYNVQDQQYVVAGELVNLEVLSRVLTLWKEKKHIQMDSHNYQATTSSIDQLVGETLEYLRLQKTKILKQNKKFVLKRGTATIPLPGIDVPFHSKKLLSGVPAFRNLLIPKLSRDRLYQAVSLLEHYYIPNLVAQPFELTKSYFQLVFDLTKSPSIKPVLEQWDQYAKEELVHILVVELLAYQFASPVQWIQTQDYLFQANKIERFIEIGPAPTLTNMAKRTLQNPKYARSTKCEILWIMKNKEVVYYENLADNEYPTAMEYVQTINAKAAAEAEAIAVNEEDQTVKSESTHAAVVAHYIPAVTSIVAATPPPPPAVSAPAQAIEDKPVDVLHVLKCYLGYSFKKSISELQGESITIQSLSAGKSAAQNEIVGEVEREFQVTNIERLAELSLLELSTGLNASNQYTQLGPVFSALTSDFLRKQLPGGFNLSQLKSYLTEEYGLGSKRTESVFVHALLFPPANRFSNQQQAKEWMDQVIADYGNYSNLSIQKVASANTFSTGIAPVAMASPAAPVQNVPDVDISPLYALKLFLAHKFNKKFNEIIDTITIQTLSAGKSAVQNEVVGDFEVEFQGASIEGSIAEMSVLDISTSLADYNAPQKYLTSTVAKMLSTKLPGGFSASSLRAYMAQERCLGPKTIEICLVHGLVHVPSARFTSEAEAKAWINTVVDDYGSQQGLTIPYASNAVSGGGVGGAMMQSAGPIVSSKALTELEKKIRSLVKDQRNAMNDFMSYDPLDTLAQLKQDASERQVLQDVNDAWEAELGDTYNKGIQSKFNPNKIRVYNSSWNWVIQDAMDFYYRTLLQHQSIAAATTTTAVSVGSDTDTSATTLVTAAKVTAPSQLESFDRDAHFSTLSPFINTEASKLEIVTQPQAWFKPFLCNRASPELLNATEYYLSRTQKEGYLEYAQAIQLLNEQVEAWLHRDPVHLQLLEPLQPVIEFDAKTGEVQYREIPRGKCSMDYVDEMSRGFQYLTTTTNVNTTSSATITTTNTSPKGLFKSTFVSKHYARGLETTELNDDENSSHNTDNNDSEVSDNESISSTTSEPLVQRKHPMYVKRHTKIVGSKLIRLRNTLSNCKLKKSSPKYSRNGSDRSTGANNNNGGGNVWNLPYVHIKSNDAEDPRLHVFDATLTSDLLQSMHEIANTGVSFAGKNAFVTGCSKGSIAIEMVRSLLEGGATVICTTSTFTMANTKFFRSVFESHGSKGSKLIVLPFNQASVRDIHDMVHYIYHTLNIDLDYIIPFAAISVAGPTVGDINSKAELAHRVMLINTYRILGKVIENKQALNITTRPALVVLPLSPNHGTFGGDGLYGEAKSGMEVLFNRWHSEGWEDYISIAGAVIGWTRGTGLMNQNNVVAPGIEQLGVRTFSTSEMAFNLTTLLHPRMIQRAAYGPLYADFGGNMGLVTDLKTRVSNIRSKITQDSLAMQFLLKERSFDALKPASDDAATAIVATKSSSNGVIAKRSNLYEYFSKFPTLPAYHQLDSIRQHQFQDLIDLKQTVVVVGFGEVGPFGNARTRWEMESYGSFSMEGCIELAWMLGYIQYHNGMLPANDNKHYIGWIDKETKKPVPDHQVKAQYEEKIVAHSGIRLVEPALFDGYNPKQKMFLQQVAIDTNLKPIEVASEEEAIEFQNELGAENVDIYLDADNDTWMMRLRQGAVLSIPKALAFNRFVAGQIPTGWDAKRLGIPQDIAEAVDPVTLYTLVSTAEALVNAGVSDPYEFYQYVHVSEVGNTSGSGMGGMRSLRRIYRERALNKSIPNDSLQECFINTMAAWVNMLLLSSSGPIKTPVGACATAAESVDIGMETILSGKARVVIVGGFDDFGEEGSYEFAQMKATSDSSKEVGMGRDPREMCRPCTDTRGGFMEAQGAGIQIIMDAALAIEMGVPIYGIVGCCNTATDKNGRSIPAPGQGILTTAKEVQAATTNGNANGAAATGENIMLNINFRHEQYLQEVADIRAWQERQLNLVSNDINNINVHGLNVNTINDMAALKIGKAKKMWGHDFYKEAPSISTLRGALNTFGLTIDDLAVSSFHGTGTNANDKNESAITHQQLEHLGRTPGNPIMVVCQKHLTGHPKGAAAAWMLNGLLQIMQSGLVPGNVNNDNTAPELQQYDHLVYPNRSIQTDGIKATMLKSFGFGQAGGEIVLIHPNYILSVLNKQEYQAYSQKRRKRMERVHIYYQNVLSEKHPLVQVKDNAPYSADIQSKVYLNPLARAVYDPVQDTWSFQANNLTPTISTTTSSTSSSNSSVTLSEAALVKAGSKLVQTISTFSANPTPTALTPPYPMVRGLGIDIEPISTFHEYNLKQTFIERNFTMEEIKYCESAPSPASSFAGKWAAKEAVLKAICSANADTKITNGSEAPLIEIEILKSASGAPVVTLYGNALQHYNIAQLQHIHVSISHSNGTAIAQSIVN